MTVLLETIPDLLTSRPQWVTWRLLLRDGKETKVPYDPKTGTLAKVNDPTTWASYPEAVAVRDQYDGLGYVLTAEDPFTGIDLDRCVDPVTGHIDPWALAVVDQLHSYTEYSPGDGLHIFVLGDLPPGNRKTGMPLAARQVAEPPGSKKPALELYDSGRYLTITGRHLAGTPATIEDRHETLQWDYAAHFSTTTAMNGNGHQTLNGHHGGDSAQPNGHARLSDLELLGTCRYAKNAEKFDTLWQGDWSDYASHSDADLALLGILKFYSQDPVQLDRLFRQSGLMREKWDERRGAQTYGERTLDEALRHVTETYTPRAARGSAAEASAATQGVEDAGTDRASRDDAPFSVWTVRRTPSGHIKPSINTLYSWLQGRAAQGHWIRYDHFLADIMLSTPAGPRCFNDEDYSRLCQAAEHPFLDGRPGFDLIGTELIRRAVALLAHDHPYDSAIEWMHALPPWDQVPRIATFCHVYLGADQTPYTLAVSRYLWSAMAGRILSPGVKADIVPIFVSRQGTGKSSAVSRMAPRPSDYVVLAFDERDADLARRTRGKTMAEFSELRGLRTRELESIKSFMTMQIDEWIPKYKEFRVSYPRRFLAIGTTNEQEFLNDPTGNRRWLPIAVSIQDLDAIDRDHDQLWAEAALLFLHHGVCWEDAHTRAEAEHAAFCIHDPWTELVTEYCASKVAAMVHPDLDVPYVHIPTFLQDALKIDPDKQDRKAVFRVRDILLSLGWRNGTHTIGGKRTKVWIQADQEAEP